MLINREKFRPRNAISIEKIAFFDFKAPRKPKIGLFNLGKNSPPLQKHRKNRHFSHFLKNSQPQRWVIKFSVADRWSHTIKDQRLTANPITSLVATRPRYGKIE
jgi:hypothetical protein